MFDHEKECRGTFERTEDKKTKVGRFHEDLFDLMTEWPTIKRLIWRMEVTEKTSHEVVKTVKDINERLTEMERVHGKG